MALEVKIGLSAIIRAFFMALSREVHYVKTEGIEGVRLTARAYAQLLLAP